MYEYCIWDKMDNFMHRGPMTQDEAFGWMEKARDVFPVGTDDIWTIKRREIGEWEAWSGMVSDEQDEGIAYLTTGAGAPISEAEAEFFSGHADTCDMCEHPSHEAEDCDGVVGYDHLNGDHFCGCQGSLDDQLAQAWDEGAMHASPHGGGYLRSILIENPYRSIE